MTAQHNLENLLNVPKDMQARNQWIVWRYEQRENSKPTKVPYCVVTGRRASVSDPKTWCTFNQAVECLRAANIPYSGLGFVFTKNDPYAGIDLDVAEGSAPSELQQFAFNKLDSYAERSPSGRGAHIIVTGTVPAGRNSQSLGIEIYDNERYFTVTGDRLNDKGIEDRSSLLLELWSEIGGVFTDADDTPHEVANPAIIDDVTLVSRICASSKNNAYYNWVTAFNWSEAYRSVLGAACLFSSDEEQIKRVILASPLVTQAPPHGSETRPRRVARLWAREYGYACRQGDTERGDQAYRIWSTQWFPGGSRELFAQVMQQAHVSAQAILAAHNECAMKTARDAAKGAHRAAGYVGSGKLPVALKTAGLVLDTDLNLSPPPGVFNDLIGEVCSRTRNPSQIMAVWAILGFVSGTVGRAYITEEGVGVNNFFILSAGSNTGKTQHWGALASIVRIAAPKLLMRIFGGDTSSPQIVAKEGQKTPSMVLRLPDAGPWLKGIIDARTQIQLQMRSALLNIYESAGTGCEWHIPKSIRAKDDGNETIDEFNMSIVLDTTPQYIADFNLSDFTDGLMSRFIMVYGPERISPLQRPKNTKDISDHLANTFDDLLKISVTCSRPNNVGGMSEAVGIPNRMVIAHEPALYDYLWSLEVEITETVRDVQSKNLPPHYIAASRVVLNAKRVAAVIAMIECPARPVVTRLVFDWALSFVLLSVTSIIRLFDSGDMGSEESKQEAAILDYIERAIRKRPHQPHVTLAELGKNMDKLAPFAKSRMGARVSRKRVLADLFEREILIETTIQTAGRPRKVITFGPYAADKQD